MSSNAPDPEVDHSPVVVPPDTIPDKLVITLFEHFDCGAPAFTVIVGVMFNVRLSLAAIHGPAGSSVVKVKIIVPSDASSFDAL